MRRLTRSSNDKMLLGVCGGIAEYLGVDPTLIRLAWVVLAAVFGTGILAYIICAIIMPIDGGSYHSGKTKDGWYD